MTQPWMTMRWYPVVKDLVGGWSVATVDKPCSAIDTGTHEHPTASGSPQTFWTRPPPATSPTCTTPSSPRSRDAQDQQASPHLLLSADARREAAERFAGLTCVVEVRPFRDNDNRHNRTSTGQVLGVAVPNTGTIADQLIVKLSDSRQYLQALSPLGFSVATHTSSCPRTCAPTNAGRRSTSAASVTAWRRLPPETAAPSPSRSWSEARARRTDGHQQPHRPDRVPRGHRRGRRPRCQRPGTRVTARVQPRNSFLGESPFGRNPHARRRPRSQDQAPGPAPGRDVALHAWADARFATDIMAEHAMFFALLMPPEIAAAERDEALRFHESFSALNRRIDQSPPGPAELDTFFQE